MPREVTYVWTLVERPEQTTTQTTTRKRSCDQGDYCSDGVIQNPERFMWALVKYTREISDIISSQVAAGAPPPFTQGIITPEDLRLQQNNVGQVFDPNLQSFQKEQIGNSNQLLERTPAPVQRQPTLQQEMASEIEMVIGVAVAEEAAERRTENISLPHEPTPMLLSTISEERNSQLQKSLIDQSKQCDADDSISSAHNATPGQFSKVTKERSSLIQESLVYQSTRYEVDDNISSEYYDPTPMRLSTISEERSSQLQKSLIDKSTQFEMDEDMPSGQEPNSDPMSSITDERIPQVLETLVDQSTRYEVDENISSEHEPSSKTLSRNTKKRSVEGILALQETQSEDAENVSSGQAQQPELLSTISEERMSQLQETLEDHSTNHEADENISSEHESSSKRLSRNTKKRSAEGIPPEQETQSENAENDSSGQAQHPELMSTISEEQLSQLRGTIYNQCTQFEKDEDISSGHEPNSGSMSLITEEVIAPLQKTHVDQATQYEADENISLTHEPTSKTLSGISKEKSVEGVPEEQETQSEDGESVSGQALHPELLSTISEERSEHLREALADQSTQPEHVTVAPTQMQRGETPRSDLDAAHDADTVRFINHEWGVEGTMIKILKFIKRERRPVTVRSLVDKGPVLQEYRAIIAAHCFTSVMKLQQHQFVKVIEHPLTLEMTDIKLGSVFEPYRYHLY